MKIIQTMRLLKFVSAVVSYLNCHQFFPQKLINTIEKFMVVYKDVYTVAIHVDITLKDLYMTNRPQTDRSFFLTDLSLLGYIFFSKVAILCTVLGVF